MRSTTVIPRLRRSSRGPQCPLQEPLAEVRLVLRRYSDEFQAVHKERGAPPIAEVAEARRRVSQYFKNLVRLCDAELVDQQALAKAFGARVFHTCVTILAPLDEAHSQTAVGKPDDPRWREFYTQLHDEARRSGKV